MQARAAIDADGLLLADTAFQRISPGVLNKEKFKAVLETLAPSTKHSERVNLGRLDALDRIIDLGPEIKSESELNKIIAEEKKKIKAAEKETPERFQKHTWVIAPNGEKVQIPNSELKSALSSGGQLAR